MAAPGYIPPAIKNQASRQAWKELKPAMPVIIGQEDFERIKARAAIIAQERMKEFSLSKRCARAHSKPAKVEP